MIIFWQHMPNCNQPQMRGSVGRSVASILSYLVVVWSCFFTLALVVWSRHRYLLEAPNDRGTLRNCGFVVVVVELAAQTGWARIRKPSVVTWIS